MIILSKNTLKMLLASKMITKTQLKRPQNYVLKK
jgi:hypothetical protein